jgi:hypothetical protein
MIEGHPLNIDYIAEVTQEDLVKGIDRPLLTAVSIIENEGMTRQPNRFGTSLDLSGIASEDLAQVTIYNTVREEDPVMKALIPDSVREAAINRLFYKKTEK